MEVVQAYIHMHECNLKMKERDRLIYNLVIENEVNRMKLKRYEKKQKEVVKCNAAK